MLKINESKTAHIVTRTWPGLSHHFTPDASFDFLLLAPAFGFHSGLDGVRANDQSSEAGKGYDPQESPSLQT